MIDKLRRIKNLQDINLEYVKHGKDIPLKIHDNSQFR